MTDFERHIREAFDVEARSAPGPQDARAVIAKTRRRQGLTSATAALVVSALALASIIGLRALGTFDRRAPIRPPVTNIPVPTPPATGTQIASGHGWRLIADEQETSRGPGLCFYLVGQHLNNTACNYASPLSGSAYVDSLGSQGALFYGKVATRAARIEVRLDNGSVVVADAFPPPTTLGIGWKLFVVELRGPRGSGTAEVFDKRGERLAIGEFRWAEGEGTGLSLSPVPSTR